MTSLLLVPDSVHRSTECNELIEIPHTHINNNEHMDMYFKEEDEMNFELLHEEVNKCGKTEIQYLVPRVYSLQQAWLLN